MRPTPQTIAVISVTPSPPALRGLITDADLPKAEEEWPGLLSFLGNLPAAERPATFLDLVWRFETWRCTGVAA
jgi:hypothetical protein